MTACGAEDAVTAGAVGFEFALPCEALQDVVSVFYEFKADLPFFEDVRSAEFFQIRFVLDGSVRYAFADGVEVPAPPFMLLGPTTGPTAARVDGPIHMFGFGLLPGGWSALVNFEASPIVNRVIDATDVFGCCVERTAQALRDASCFQERVEIGNAFAQEMMARDASSASDFTRSVDQWLASSPSPDVEELVRAVGVSRRQVERNCKRFYGAPPKVLARRYRALKAAIAIAKGDQAHDLVHGGFYDQSHFIREIKHFTGMTPGKIADEFTILAKLTLKQSEVGSLRR